jgi:thiol-disulfide isomerase/thioredoxin
MIALSLIVIGGVARADLFLGDPMPRTGARATSVDGREIVVDNYVGDAGTLVIFTCNSCDYGKSLNRRAVELAHLYRAEGVGAVLVNSNDPSYDPADDFEQMKAVAKELELKVPYVVDDGSVLAKAFGARVTPEVFLFDGGGRLVYHGAVNDGIDGASDAGQEWLAWALESLVKGDEIAQPITEAVGCDIRFHERRTE